MKLFVFVFAFFTTFLLAELAKSLAGLTESEESFIASLFRKGTNRPGTSAAQLASEIPKKKVTFKTGIPRNHAVLGLTNIDPESGQVSFQPNGNSYIDISLQDLLQNDPKNFEDVKRIFDLDEKDAKAIYWAFNMYNTGKSVRFKGEPPTEHITPEILTSSFKSGLAKIPVKDEKDAQMEFYNSLKKSLLKRVKFVRDELDEEGLGLLENLGRLLSQKYDSKEKLTDSDERYLEHLLYENGYHPLHGIEQNK
jgi:hypothetical protein